MKNKKTILIILSIVVIVIIVSLVLVFNNKKNKNETNMDYTDTQLYTLIYKHKLMYFDIVNKSFKVTELTTDDISEYIYNIYKNYFEKNNLNNFSAEEVDVAIQSIFGNQVNYQHNNLHYDDKTQKYNILYDAENKIYYPNGEYEIMENNNISFTTKQTLKKDNDKYIFTLEKFFFVNENNKTVGIYGNITDAINRKNIIYDISSLNVGNERKEILKNINSIVDKNYKELTKKTVKYKYTFIVQNNNLYLYSYEIV